MKRALRVLLWIVTLLFAFVFLMVGVTKLTQNPAVLEQFAGWGYPTWFLLAIGAAEVLGALLLVWPRTAKFGAYLLIPIMAGAIFTHIRAGEWPNPLFNALFAAGLYWIARSRS